MRREVRIVKMLSVPQTFYRCVLCSFSSFMNSVLHPVSVRKPSDQYLWIGQNRILGKCGMLSSGKENDGIDEQSFQTLAVYTLLPFLYSRNELI